MSHNDVVIPYRFPKGQIMMRLMKRHDVVTFSDVTQHILPYNSAEERLINYSILKTILLYFKYIHFVYPSGIQSAQTLDYFHYITLHVYIIQHYHGISQLAL